MTSVCFRTGAITLELSGSEAFVDRQLQLFSPFLGQVDVEALDTAPVREPMAPSNGDSVELADDVAVHEPPAALVAAVSEPGPESIGPESTGPADEVTTFFQSFEPSGQDRQADAALLFAYYLQRKEGMRSLGLGDLIRCCIRAGVDTRNFNRTVGTLTRRGFLETVRHGHAYRLSEQGVAVVENRM